MDRPTPLAGKVRLREVTDADLPTFFEHQREPDANRMAAFPARDRQAFMAHWSRTMADPAALVQTILVGEEVAGYVASWESEGRRLVGYWIGRDWWGRGVASAGLAAFLECIPTRSLYARVAKHNRGSIRVLEKCGFQHSGTGLVRSTSLGGAVAVDYFRLDRRAWASLSAWRPAVRRESFGGGK